MAETEGRIAQERTNHDLVLEKKRLEAKENRETVLESIRLASSTIGAGFKEYIADTDKLFNTAATLTAIGFGLYTAKVSTGVLGRYIEARLGKPSLVRETTKKNFIQMMRSPIKSAKLAYFSAGTKAAGALNKIVLEKNLSDQLSRVAVSTANTKKNRAPFRHLLLHGPPGTGKTMFAKGLARESGLHYAIMTGGDVAPLGKDAVTEVHKLFDWASTTNKGVLLFIDEADAFLRRRSTEAISEDMRNALNAFLYRTGEATDKFMVVFASNQPEQFDSAINDRIDEMVEFVLPTFDERRRMIDLYVRKYLERPNESGGFFKAKKIFLVGIEDAELDEAARRTENFSGREISKLAIAWQAAAYGTTDAKFTAEMMSRVLDEHVQQKAQKKAWLDAAVGDSGDADSGGTYRG